MRKASGGRLCGMSDHDHDHDHDHEGEVVEVPIDGVLDLHTFRPRDVGEVVEEYLKECRKRGILQVRIVHGKGKGQLRRTVEATLRRMPEIASFRLAGNDAGGWGATMVDLHAPGSRSMLPPSEE
jgi:DNA-nicking Smr family endonuclease